ncbi:HAMP domain-containing sensor histidine kinase [Kutzneria albida]|uniref:histidine kinase n=1 Tax=Kutzneria albida DSM 43870 TaxID=1449976 RepID=W5VYU7_9PSEU|nr:Signal transduction histidine-protein kinase/phosphatase mprB [Kutzneria albida DSM 43870]
MTATEYPEVHGVPVEQLRPRKRSQRISLRSRVTLLTAFCVAGAVALVSIGAYFTVSQNLYAQARESLIVRVQALSKSLSGSSGPRVDVNNLFPLEEVHVDVVDSKGSSYANVPMPMRLNHGWLGAGEKAVASGSSEVSSREYGGYEIVAVPFTQGTALVVAEPLDQVENTLKKLSLVLVFVGLGGVLVAALAGTAVAQGGLRPVSRLRQATERVAATGDLTPIPVSGDDELALLTTSFNAMLGALAESQERQRRLVGDAGHELRTPLTSLRTNLELLLASEKPGAPTLSEQDRAEIYDDVRAQIAEMTTLIGDLVELAREDAPQAVHEPVELVEIVERALDRARRRGSGVGFEVQLQPWFLLGEAHALERAVLNLLDNAIKFSPSDGVVRLTMRSTTDGAMLIEVADSGPGIAEADLPHVFERFYRSSEARTLPGSGLGLAIVAQAVHRHGGTVFAGRAPEGGALMTIRLPGRPTPAASPLG